MASTSIRWTVTKHLVDALRNHQALSGVLVEPGWPGEDNLRPSTIYVDELRTESLLIPVASAGRKNRDDKFAIPFMFRVVDAGSLDDTMTRLTQLVAAVEDVLADSPTIDDMDGVVSAEVTDETMTAGLRPDGYVGYGQLVVSVHSRLE